LVPACCRGGARSCAASRPTRPALGRVLDGVWAAARRRLLGLAPLGLRKP